MLRTWASGFGANNLWSAGGKDLRTVAKNKLYCQWAPKEGQPTGQKYKVEPLVVPWAFAETGFRG
jgi:hypothetical protein